MRKFYAMKKESLGCTVHVFDNKKARDQFVERSIFANPLPANRVERSFKAQGNYTRFATVADQIRHYS